MTPSHSPGRNRAAGEVRLRVRYQETDQMGLVYHSNFAIWFEVGRVEWLRQLGLTYRDMERSHDCYIPVVDLRCRYKAPARYDDEILVRTRLKNIRESLLRFAYQVLRARDLALLAEGETTHIVVNRHLQRVPLSQEYQRTFEDAVAHERGIG